MWQHYISSTRFLLEAINNYLAFFFVTRGLFRDFLEFIYVIYHRTRYHAVIICKGVYQIAEWDWNYFEVPKRKNFFNIQVLLGGNLTLHIPFSLQKIIFLSPSVRLRRWYYWTFICRKSVLIYFDCYHGIPDTHKHGKKRIVNTLLL